MDVFAVEDASEDGHWPIVRLRRRARIFSNAARIGSGDTPCTIRSFTGKVRVEQWKKRDPIRPSVGRLRRKSSGRTADLESWRPKRSVAKDTDEAMHSLIPAHGVGRRSFRFVYSERVAHEYAPDHLSQRHPGSDSGRLRRDERVFLMGEDVGRYGGCYAVSKGLLQEFGPERIRDTPLSESAFVGAGIGAGSGRHAADRRDHDCQLQPARARSDPEQRRHSAHMSGGQFNVPIVIRMATGGRTPACGTAFAQPGRLVRAHSRHQGAHTRPPLRMLTACCWQPCKIPIRC